MLEPLSHHVIIELEDADYTTNGLFIIPTKKRSREFMKKQEVRTLDHTYNLHIREGEIVSVGEGVKDVEEGDTVLINIHNGEQFTHDEGTYLSIHEQHLMALMHRNSDNEEK